MLRFIITNARVLIIMFNTHVNKGKEIYIRGVNSRWGYTNKLDRVFSLKKNTQY